jgi:hypothetical protein
MFEGTELHHDDVIYCANGKKMRVSSLYFDKFKVQAFEEYTQTSWVNYNGELIRFEVLGKLFSRTNWRPTL